MKNNSGIDTLVARAAWAARRRNGQDGIRKAKDAKDERHICPLQLDVIERCLTLWSNPGDVVLSPFAGIGSEGYVAVQHGRRFVGIELKPSYYKWAVKHLAEAAALASRQTIFDEMDEQTEIELVEAA